MVEIRPLLDLEPQDRLALNRGYTSTAMYRVSKSETPEETIIQLALAPLSHPYTKRWYHA